MNINSLKILIEIRILTASDEFIEPVYLTPQEEALWINAASDARIVPAFSYIRAAPEPEVTDFD